MNAESRYLSLKELGVALEELRLALPRECNYLLIPFITSLTLVTQLLAAAVFERRRFPKTLKSGSPNLLVTSPGKVHCFPKDL